MKIIKYRVMTEVQCGFGKNSGVVQSFSERTDDWSEEAEEWVRSIAYNGEYTIEDDGEPEPSAEPTQLDRVEAQATYTAMMTDTLLEG